MRRVLGPLAAACFLFAAAGQSSAATSHCLASDYAMQCAKIPTANPTARTAVATVAGPGATLGPSAKARLAPVYRYGVDFGWSSVSASTASRVGARFGASYLSIDYSKNWTRAMLNSYHAQGLPTVAVWETTATRALAGYYAGRSDARTALSQEQALGIPTSKPVYFAIDFPEQLSQWPAVKAYFIGVNSIMGVSRTGAYGDWAAISRVFNSRLVRYGWQTSAWSADANGVIHWDGRAQIQQYAYHATYDWDRAMSADFGQSF